jgi:hypothetical protein
MSPPDRKRHRPPMHNDCTAKRRTPTTPSKRRKIGKGREDKSPAWPATQCAKQGSFKSAKR